MEGVQGQVASAEDVRRGLARVQQVPTATEKVALLHRLRHSVPMEPAAVAAVFLDFAALEQDTLVEVRSFVVDWMEAVCLSLNDFLPLCLGVLVRMVTQQTSTMLRSRVLEAATVLLRPSLRYVAAQQPSDATVKLWTDLLQLKVNVVALLHPSTPSGLVLRCLHFLHLAVMAFSPAGSERTQKESQWSIEMVPQQHPLVSAAALKEEGEALLSKLMEQLNSRLCNSNYCAVFNALTGICKSRVQLLNKIMPALIAFGHRLVDQPHAPSVQRAFKFSLGSILRIRSSAVQMWLEQITSLLSTLPSSRDAPHENLKRPFSEISSGTTEPSSKRQKEEIQSSTDSEVPQSLPLNAIEMLITQLPFEMIVELIVEGMEFLPPLSAIPTETPSPVQTNFQDIMNSLGSTPNSSSSIPKLDPRRDPRLTPKQLVEVQPSSASLEIPIPAVETKPTPNISIPLRSAESMKQERKQRIDDLPRAEDVQPHLQTPKPFPGTLCKKLVDAAFLRILQAEETIEMGGKTSTVLRRKLLARLATQMPLDGDVLLFLMKHIADSFSTRKELALTWLFQEAYNPAQRNRYSDIFLLLLQSVSKSLDPRDRLFTYLLLEAPELPSEAFATIQSYCEDPERIALGLSTLRDLVLYRLPYRDESLKMLLSYTSHKNEIIRSPAIRLVINRLYFQSESVTSTIDEYAMKLLNLMDDQTQPKDEKTTDEDFSPLDREIEQAETSSKESGKEDATEEEAKRHILLYFGLCTKNHELLHRIAQVYAKASPSVRKVFHQQVPGLVRAIGNTSASLMQLIGSFPRRSEPLILHFLHILTEASPPTESLVTTVKNLYQKHHVDSRFLVPILPGLQKEEIVDWLPKLVALPSNVVKMVISRLLNDTPSISPSELLVVLHTIEGKEQLSIKQVVEAIQLCLEQKEIFQQKVIAVALQQLVDISPIPSLLMRTVILSVGRFPKLMSFIMGILSRLIGKQIWNDRVLWEGFIKCCKMTMPHSLPILSQLPPPQLESALKGGPELKDPLVAYCHKNNITLKIKLF